MAKKEKEDKNLRNNNVSQKKTGPVRIATTEQLYEKVIQSYKETIDHMRWCIGLSVKIGLTFISIALAFIIYIGIVKSVDIHYWEKKADTTISTIDNKVENSLTEIEEKGNETIKHVSMKAKVYLDRLFLWYLAKKAEEEGDDKTAIKHYEEINKLAEKEKDDETVDEIPLEPTYAEPFPMQTFSMTAHIPAGHAYFRLSEKEQDEQRKRQLLISAEENLELGIKKREGYDAFYDLARISALENNENECRRRLEEGGRKGALPTRKIAEADPVFYSMRDEDWFKNIPWADDSGK